MNEKYIRMPATNKPIAYMAADVKTQTSVLRKNISDYPQCSLLETATKATAKTLAAMLDDRSCEKSQ